MRELRHMSHHNDVPAGSGELTPGAALCVDLDGTLLRSDLLYESLLALLAQPAVCFAGTVLAARQGLC